MRFLLRTLLLLPLIALLLLPVIDRSNVAVWVGGFQVNVQLDDEFAAKTQKVSFLGVRDRVVADDVIGAIDVHQKLMHQTSATKELDVHVRTSGKISWFGRELEYGQAYSHLVFLLHHQDGSKSIHLVDVPERGQPRKVELSEATMVQRYEKNFAN